MINIDEDVTVIQSCDGMTWFIIPLEPGKKCTHYVVDHQFRGGRLVVEGKRYRTYIDALEAVRKQKDERDRAILLKN